MEIWKDVFLPQTGNIEMLKYENIEILFSLPQIPQKQRSAAEGKANSQIFACTAMER